LSRGTESASTPLYNTVGETVYVTALLSTDDIQTALNVPDYCYSDCALCTYESLVTDSIASLSYIDEVCLVT